MDDSEDDILLLKTAFRNAGHDVALRVATNGREAFDRLEHGEGVPDLLLLDLNMPGMSGFEVLERIREEGEFSGMKVLIFSSSQHEQDVRRAYEGGADGYLMKPLDFSELVEVARAIRRFLGASEEDWRLLEQLPCYRFSRKEG